MTALDHVEVAAIVERAVGLLTTADAQLLDIDVNERSLSHRLAVYLIPCFTGWDVDCEYNRSNDLTKKIKVPGPVGSDDLKATTIYPDIIVHKRRVSGAVGNLLVIEMKKEANGDGAFDLTKLAELLKPPYSYQHALFLRLMDDGEACYDWRCVCASQPP